MANPHRGQAVFHVGEDEYLLHFTWNAAAVYESQAGRPISDAMMDTAARRFSATSVRAMLWAGLREHHPKITLQECGELIDKAGRVEATKAMTAALLYFFPELEEKDDDSDPPKPPSEQ